MNSLEEPSKLNILTIGIDWHHERYIIRFLSCLSNVAMPAASGRFW